MRQLRWPPRVGFQVLRTRRHAALIRRGRRVVAGVLVLLQSLQQLPHSACRGADATV